MTTPLPAKKGSEAAQPQAAADSGRLSFPRAVLRRATTWLGAALIILSQFAPVPSVTLWLGIGLLSWSLFRALRSLLLAKVTPPASREDLPLYERVNADIRKLRFMDGIENEGEKLYEQLQRVRELRKRFDETLNKRLSPEELTFSRFQRPFHAAHDTLLMRIASFGQDLRTWASLREEAPRQELRIELDRAQGDIRAALEEMEKLLVAVQKMKTGDAVIDLETQEALERLRELVARAERFHSNSPNLK